MEAEVNRLASMGDKLRAALACGHHVLGRPKHVVPALATKRLAEEMVGLWILLLLICQWDRKSGLNTISQMVPKTRFLGKVGEVWFLVS